MRSEASTRTDAHTTTRNEINVEDRSVWVHSYFIYQISELVNLFIDHISCLVAQEIQETSPYVVDMSTHSVYGGCMVSFL